MKLLAEAICGTGYIPDWDAISSIFTALAVFVALWIPARERAIKQRDRLEAEARAAEIVGQSLAPAIEILPRVISYIRQRNGIIIETPVTNVLYGIDACREILEKESFFSQLPTSCLGSGALVCSLARKWCLEIDTHIQTQRNAQLRAAINWQNHDFTCHLGEQLHGHALSLKKDCAKVRHTGHLALLPLHKRLSLIPRQLWCKKPDNAEETD